MVEFGLLLDYYGEFLTDNQLKAMNLYLNDDWSISEIAEYLGISRQGAHDFIKKSKTLLLEYESKLHVVERSLKSKELLKSVIDDCKVLLGEMNNDSKKKLCNDMKERLEKLLNEI